MAHTRRLTVSLLVRPPVRRFGRELRAPQLRLAGRWLEAAGFVAGQVVTVDVEPGRLIITTPPVPAEGPSIDLDER
jgi:hypothetical protein